MHAPKYRQAFRQVGHCKQHYRHRTGELKNYYMVWGSSAVLRSRPLFFFSFFFFLFILKRRPSANTCKQLCFEKQNCVFTVYGRFGFLLRVFVCKVLIFSFFFLFPNSEYIGKKTTSLFPFQKCWPPTVVSHALFLLYSLLNMFVTVAVIIVWEKKKKNRKTCWQFEAICCISPCVSTVRSITHTMDIWVWVRLETKRVDQTTTDVVRVRVCERVCGWCVYVCMLLPVIMWARLLTIQMVHTKKMFFRVHLVYCWLCDKNNWH